MYWMKRRVGVTSDIYYNADDAEVQEDLRSRAARLAIFRPDNYSFGFDQVLEPKLKVRRTNFADVKAEMKVKDGEPFFADLFSNGLNLAGRGSRTLPSITQHCDIYSFKANRCMTTCEKLSVHGIISRERNRAVGPYYGPSPFPAVLSQLSQAMQANLCGLSWHYATVGTFIMFVLASTVRRRVSLNEMSDVESDSDLDEHIVII